MMHGLLSALVNPNQIMDTQKSVMTHERYPPAVNDALKSTTVNFIRSNKKEPHQYSHTFSIIKNISVRGESHEILIADLLCP